MFPLPQHQANQLLWRPTNAQCHSPYPWSVPMLPRPRHITIAETMAVSQGQIRPHPRTGKIHSAFGLFIFTFTKGTEVLRDWHPCIDNRAATIKSIFRIFAVSLVALDFFSEGWPCSCLMPDTQRSTGGREMHRHHLSFQQTSVLLFLLDGNMQLGRSNTKYTLRLEFRVRVRLWCPIRIHPQNGEFQTGKSKMKVARKID